MKGRVFFILKTLSTEFMNGPNISDANGMGYSGEGAAKLMALLTDGQNPSIEIRKKNKHDKPFNYDKSEIY